MAASVAATASSPEVWEETRQAAYADVQPFDLAVVSQAWHRLILGEPATDGPALHLEGSGTRSAG
jgi:hypothetical protein